ncbi:MAG: HNH endonuclease [Lachnospiraceae bacterium]|nr:HNH endonuclease [Lachnospiraceae bacterium]
MISRRVFNRIISVILIISMLTSMVGCSSDTPNTGLSDPNPQVITENIEVENVDIEEIITEHITDEIYLEEFVIAENKITELLLDEEMINEVVLCKTIYVPEENIEDFADHSQTAQLFGEGFDIKPVLKKVAIGTGIIITVAIVKKAGVPKPIASVVAAAADESMQFAASGAAVGTVFGAFTGAANEIDESGRATAVAGFALATAGLIITAVSLVGSLPSAGTSSFGVAEGVHLAWAGIKFLLAAGATVYAARDTVKAFTSTDVSEIDWDNVDWDAVGVASAQQAIQNGADGYMWGAIYGAIDGTVEGYYLKYHTPYSQYSKRIEQTPKNDEYGHWSGERGESEYIYDKSKTIKISEERSVTVEAGTKVTYQNGVPDFSPFQVEQVKIQGMTASRTSNFKLADEALAKEWTRIRQGGKTWTAREVEAYRTSNGLTWHEMNNMELMQLVPTEVNAGFGHLGGVGEYNAMVRAEGGTGFE